ncbi:Alpha/Beta hydrolase protein [Pseudoneurospora amorphoporcata]|uniref:Alpha/Beta hydrolase protein n=1 Tax=Pseudoneurospora amorphoporcata TaxID=241081 RepID=A0AAN6NZN9_9PEZI|nr:Alpha/Beta hydrolase protein [Pseudoneurospora amorphoporcata]
MESLFLQTAPPLDPAWLAFEEESGVNKPHQELPIAEHQVAYAAECRSLNAKMLAPGARDHHLSLNVAKTEFIVPSAIASPSVDEADCYQVPVIRYQHTATSSASDSAAAGSQAEEQPDITVLYIHGGGLYVGEADSEELFCLRILKATSVPTTKNVNDTKPPPLIKEVYSLTYRLMPTYPAQDSLSDCLSVLNYILNQHRPDGNNHKLIIAGSSSGGRLVGLLSQHPCALGRAFSGLDPYVPLRFRLLHTSAWDPSFWNSLLGQMKRGVPRDGLERMPLEADETILKTLPRTWIQLCTNDNLYSDGLCYAKALEEVGVEVKVDVVRGWPHTFWLKAPGLERALEAEEEMVRWLGGLLG